MSVHWLMGPCDCPACSLMPDPRKVDRQIELEATMAHAMKRLRSAVLSSAADDVVVKLASDVSEVARIVALAERFRGRHVVSR